MNVDWRLHAMSAPAAIRPTSAAATTVPMARRRPNQFRTPITPTPASAGIANPNVTSLSAGYQPVRRPSGAPRTTSAAQIVRIRRAVPLVLMNPSAARGIESHCT